MTGHVFVLHTDLMTLSCDDVLVPTDSTGYLSHFWNRAAPIPRDLLSGLKPGGLIGPEGVGAHVIRTWWVSSAWEQDDHDIDWLVSATTHALAEMARWEPGDRAWRNDRSRRLIGIPLFGVGYGGFANDRGEVIRRLLSGLKALTAEFDVDVAVCCFSRSDYAAVQSQREPSDWAELLRTDLGLMAEADLLGKRLRQGKLAVFIGAGLSAGAGLPTWNALIDHLASAIGLDEARLKALKDLNVLDRAAVLRREAPETFDAELKKALTSDHTGLGHALLASARPREVVTTNFDTLYETAAVVPYDSSLTVLPKQRGDFGTPWLLKMHGDIGGSVILNREDYRTYDSSWKPLASMFQAVMLTRHVLFVGFSLADDNFLRLGREVIALLERLEQPTEIGTTVALFNEPLFSALWGSDLKLVPMTDSDTDVNALAVAARQQEIFFDRVAWQAVASEDAYLLDERYAPLLNNLAELDTANRLRELAARLPVDPRWHGLRSALRSAGATVPGRF